MLDLLKKRVLVIGLGKTGIAAARFLSAQGAVVTVTDAKPAAQLSQALNDISDLNIAFGKYETNLLAGADLVVPSPGVAPSNPLLMEGMKRNVPVLSELELAARFIKTPMIAITGTNGKTTTTTLIGEILKACGKEVFVGGNIGSPLIGYVTGPQQADFAVVEVSSFQLQWTERFQPAVAILLNTTCDHIDYHGSFAAYRAAKERIFANQTGSDLAILNSDEDYTLDLSNRIAAGVRFFSSTRRAVTGMFVEGETLIYDNPSGGRETYPLAMIKLPGRHNIENVMAAIMAVRYCGCPANDVIRAIDHFRGMSHRIEFVAERSGVKFYDDSKGTNVDAVKRALETFSAPVVLLMGGRDKDSDFTPLISTIKEKVVELVLFGEARDRINAVLGGIVKTAIAETLKKATELAYRQAASGQVVLLSPGCASFDEFTDYKERGRFFRQTVEGMG
jgi:UDP-N-acetylmuramoylalanine--D-glutamate ligase